MLDFRIKTFLTVCETMNYTKASQILNITQPAVSQHIQYLEQQYHVVLFKHEGKKLILTNEGKLLRKASLRMNNEEIHLTNLLKESKQKAPLYIWGYDDRCWLYYSSIS